VKLTLAAAICWENYMPLLRQSLYSQNVNLYLAPTADGRDTWLGLLRTIAIEGRCVVLSANQCLRESDLPTWITGKAGRREEKTNGEGRQIQAKSRRKSTIECENGNEIALPVPKESIPLIEEESETTNGTPKPTRLRRKSTITEDGNEIVLPEVKEKPARLRRQSTITDDGNEIALPSPRASTFQSTVEERTKSKEGEFISRGGSCMISPLGEVLAGPLWDDDDGLLVYDVDFDDCLRGRLDLDVAGSYSRYENPTC
jgi:nitrilase